MPKKIILVRHGETDYNLERRMQGWLDISLNESGRSQAHVAAAKLQSIKINAIYTSDLKRAYETAQTIGCLIKQKVTPTPALRERDMGIFAGWAWESERDPAKDKLWQEFEEARDNEDLTWNKHSGESVGQMSTRITIFMQHLHAQHTDQTIVVVTHGGTINRILEQYQIKPAKEGFRPITNAGVLILHKHPKGYQLQEI